MTTPTPSEADQDEMLLFTLYAYRRVNSQLTVEIRELSKVLGDELALFASFTPLYNSLMRLRDNGYLTITRGLTRVHAKLTPHGLDVGGDIYKRRMAEDR